MPPLATVVVLTALAVTFLFVAVSFVIPTLSGAPWVPSSSETIRKMLSLSKVRPGEKVYDLGSGDGRVVVIAAREFGATSTGVELDPFRAYYSSLMIWALGLRGRARVVRASFYDVDLSDADVVTLYLLQETNDKLRPKLERELRPGSRVVSHVFRFDWRPIEVDETSKVYVYAPGAGKLESGDGSRRA